MEKENVEQYLEAFGLELERRGFANPIEILIVGGTHMVMKIGSRPSTEDIDFRFLSDGLDLTRLPLTRLEKAFRSAIKVVATQHGLPPNWLNDDAGPFVSEYVPNPERTFWRAFGPLHVYFTNNETMLAYKLMGYSAKQQPDIEVLTNLLHISTYDEVKAVLDRLVPQETQQEFGVEDTLQDLFE